MRNWHPFLHETLAEMKDRGRRRALGIILSSLQTEASWARYVEDVAAAREKVGPDAPEVVYAPPWSDHPRFIEAMADRARAALAAIAPARRADAPLVFTAHSVPVAMAAGSPYAAQLEAAARAVAAAARPADGWSRRLPEPQRLAARSVARARRRRRHPRAGAGGARDVVVVPVGFVCDHVEVLYDLDVEAQAVAESCGIGFHRAAAANDHPAFIAMLADLVRRGAGVVKLIVVGGGLSGLAAAHRAVELARERGRPLDLTAARGRRSPGRHHRRPSAATASWSSAGPTRSSPRSRGRSRSAAGSAWRTG